jgi:alkanesulfonate monooxygenase SsuD/methylene tetrahydromethanopterin reductase-like flavin-dependent oxidoreductase (luciferase family)
LPEIAEPFVEAERDDPPTDLHEGGDEVSLSKIDQSCRRAVVFTPMETDRRVVVDAGVLADRLGYEAVIVPEGWGFDATAVLTEIALRTERIRLVSGIFSVWGRSTATLAMAAATLDDVAGGRFTLGLGTSTAQLAERFHGVAYARPAATLRRTVTDVRALLRGDRARTASGVKGVRLNLPPRPGLPIWVAALGPRATEVATECADGWFPAVVPRDRLDAVRTRALATARGDPELVCGPMTVAATPGMPARATAEQIIAWYLVAMGPVYGDFVAAHGYRAEVEALRSANPKPVPGQLRWPDTADALLAQLAAYGDLAEVGAQLAEWDPLADVVVVLIAPGPRDAALAAVTAAAPP